MYDDFKKENYWRAKHKIHQIKDLIDRISADYDLKLARIIKLEDSIGRMKINPLAPGVTQLPDLIVKEMYATLETFYTTITMIVQNIGKGASPECKLRLFISGVNPATIDFVVPPIQINDTTTITSIYYFDANGFEYSINASANVNFDLAIQESDTSNNTNAIDFLAKQKFIVPQDDKPHIYLYYPQIFSQSPDYDIGFTAQLYYDVSKLDPNSIGYYSTTAGHPQFVEAYSTVISWKTQNPNFPYGTITQALFECHPPDFATPGTYTILQGLGRYSSHYPYYLLYAKPFTAELNPNVATVLVYSSDSESWSQSVQQ